MVKSIFRFVFGVMLSLLLSLNFAQISLPNSNQFDDVLQATFIPTNLKWGTAHYDSTAAANFIGCWGQPKDCLMLVGASFSVTFSPNGIDVALE